MSRAALIGKLRRHPIWTDAPDQAVRALAERLREVPLAAGDSILRAGDAADAIHLLVRGVCRVFYPATERSAEVTVKLFGAPVAFGDAESILKALVLVCDAASYFDILQREPRVCFRQYWDVSRRFGIAIQTERRT